MAFELLLSLAGVDELIEHTLYFIWLYKEGQSKDYH